jgi:hypothetical protein
MYKFLIPPTVSLQSSAYPATIAHAMFLKGF